MSHDIIRGVISDHGYFYLGTIVDGARSRGVGGKGLVITPRAILHVIYMQDTDSILGQHLNRTLVSSRELQRLCHEALGHDWEVTFHELGELVGGLLDGDISYLDWLRLPIINEPEPRYISQILSELQNISSDCFLALTARMTSTYQPSWMPLDYRWVQMLVFARTGKLEVNYFTLLSYLQENANDYEVYESAMAEFHYQNFYNQLNSIETKARRGIL